MIYEFIFSDVWDSFGNLFSLLFGSWDPFDETMPVPNRRTKTIAGRDAHHFQGPLFPERRNAILPPPQRPYDLHVSIAAEDPLIRRGLAVRFPRLVVSSASAAAAFSRPTKPKVVQQRLIVVAAPQIVEDQDQTKFHLPTSKFLFSHIKNTQLPVFELAIIRALSSNNRHQEPKNTHTHTHWSPPPLATRPSLSS